MTKLRMAEDKFTEYKNLSTKQRREELIKLFLKRGSMYSHSLRRLSKIFGVSHSAIWRDMKAISKNKDIQGIPNYVKGSEYDYNKIKSVDKLLDMINNEGTENRDKISAIVALIGIIEKEIGWLYKLGLIEIEPEKIKVEEEHKISLLQVVKLVEEIPDEGERILRVRAILGM